MTTRQLEHRAVVESDRWLLLEWRNQERVREFSAGADRIAAEDHGAWFDRLMAERADQFVMLMLHGRPVGVVQLEGMNARQRRCSWGCHLGETDVPPGTGACLPLIGLGLGFGRFTMRRMTAQALATNTNIRGIHRRLGVTQEGVLRKELIRPGGDEVDVYQYGVLSDEWPAIRDRAERLLPKSMRDDVGAMLDLFRPRAVDR